VVLRDTHRLRQRRQRVYGHSGACTSHEQLQLTRRLQVSAGNTNEALHDAARHCE
jgi:hypothetical protein